MTQEALLKVAEVAAILAVSEAQVYLLIQGGRLGCHRITRRRNGCIRVSRAQLAAFLEATEAPAGEKPERKRLPRRRPYSREVMEHLPPPPGA